MDLDKGTWLVIVGDGSTSAISINPDFPEVDAAIYVLKDEMMKAMMEESKLRPLSVRMSDKEIKAWEAYEKIIGKDKPSYLGYSSMNDIAESGCKVIRDKAKKEKRKYKSKGKININPIFDLEL